MKKIVSGMLSLFLIVQLILPIGMKQAKAESFLSDEMAQKFVDLFYQEGDEMTSIVTDILTGKQEGTIDEIKEIYSKAVTVLGIVNQPDLFDGVSGVVISDMEKVTLVVSGALEIYDNAKSFAESENNAQKMIDGIQIISGFLSIVGKNDLIPPQFNIALKSIETGLEIGGFLEKAYLLEGLQLYEADLAVAYFSGSELPYVSPTVLVGSQISQEEAEALYATKYMEYKMREIAPEIFNNSDGSETDESGIAGNIVDRNIDLSKTTYIDDNLTINSTLNLNDEILIVKENIIQNGGILNLDDGLLIVQGNYQQTGGTLNVENGYIEINGDYTTNANLVMNSNEGYMLVRGDMTVACDLSYGGRNNITAGVLELKGDFCQYGDRNGIWYTEDADHSLLGFCASGTHKTILSGMEQQTIYMQGRVHEGFNDYPNCSKFNVLESKNPNAILKDVSANAITSNSVFKDFGVSYVILNDTQINVSGNASVRSALVFNNSKINIGGNLTNDGRISMSHPQDTIIVARNYTQYYENNSEFLDGTLEIKGDMVDCGGYQPTAKHKTILSGDGAQNIDMHYYKSYGQKNYYGKFNSLEILNTSTEGITISETPAKVYGQLTMLPEAFITNPLEIYLCDDATVKGTWCGGLTLNNWVGDSSTLICGNVNIIGQTIFNKQQKIKGDVTVSGTLIINDKLVIEGSLMNLSSIHMNTPESYVLLSGDYTHKLVNSSMFTDGIFEIKGNIIDCGGYVATKNHKTILSGDSEQNIDMHYYKSYGQKNYYGSFNILDIANTSNSGIIFGDDKIEVSGSIYQPIGTNIVNSSIVLLQGQTAFVDYGNLNKKINEYVGNNTSVIPTWLDYEKYIHKDYLTIIDTSTPYTHNDIKSSTVMMVSDTINDISIFDTLYMTDGTEVREVTLSDVLTTKVTGPVEVGFLIKNIPYANVGEFQAKLGNSNSLGEE